MSNYPSRIVCLTEEPTKVLYALGEEHRADLDGLRVVRRRHVGYPNAHHARAATPFLSRPPARPTGFGKV